MTKINENNNKLRLLYQAGFFIILALPILVAYPYFYPADWGKSIIFRSVLSVMLFVFLRQTLYGKSEFSSPSFKKNYIAWALGAFFAVFLLASMFSVDPYFSFWASPFRGGGFITFSFCFLFSLMSFVVLKKEDPSANSGLTWKKAWIFSIFIGILVSLIAIIQYYGFFNKIFLAVSSQPSSTMGNPIPLAIYLLLLSFITLSFAIKETNKHLKIFYIVSLFLFLFTILISGTRAAYLGIFIGALYFLLFYPKKFKLLKTCVGLFLILIFLIVLYANIHPQLPTILQNRITKDVVISLSIKNALHDERFRAWQTVLQEIEDKPILGWGPENMSVGFDKSYDPRITSFPWWDRAHNIFLDTGAQTGILGIITYILLFIILFWSLQKIKHKKEHKTQIIINGIQATLIGYLVANFFSFDSFGTYLIFFMLIAYSMHLIYGENAHNESQILAHKKSFWKPAFIFVLFIILLIFLWQYNLVPLQINAELNRAKNLSDQKQCDQAFVLLDKTLQEHSFVDSYAIMKYVDFEKTCAGFYPQNNLTYINKGLEFMNEAVKIQPLYTRYWLNMGELTTVLAGQQEDNLDLIKRANSYFDKALELAPKHQEIYIAKIKLDITDTDYKNAENHSYKCIDLNPALADCYWYKGVSEIYLKNYKDAQNNIQLAKEKKYNVNSQTSLIELANAYGFIPDYKNLADVFEKIVAINPNVAQYHSLLASFYAKLGKYDKAQQEQEKAEKLSPSK